MGQSDLDRAAALTNSYVTQNPNPVGSKQLYDVAPGAQAYHASHKVHHASFRETLALKNYDDLVIFDTRGNVVYTVNKNTDFAQNAMTVTSGDYGDSGLGEAYRGAMLKPEEVFIGQWKSYGAIGGGFTNFLAKAIKSAAGQIVGVYATQMPLAAKPIECQSYLSQAITSFDAVLVNLERDKRV